MANPRAQGWFSLASLMGMASDTPARLRPGKYRPHQSMRECARRLGGPIWAQFKAMDRVRRGLPA